MMKFLTKIIIVILYTIFFYSCSSITVSVSTADSDMVYKESIKIQNRTYTTYLNAIGQVYTSNLFDKETINKIVTEDINNGILSGEIEAGDKIELIDNTLESISKATAEIQDIYVKAMQLVNEQKYSEAQLKFKEANRKGNELKYIIEDELGTTSITYKEIETFSLSGNNVVKTVKKIKGGRDNLLDDPLVPFITKNDKKDALWSSSYNKTKSSTFSGKTTPMEDAMILMDCANTSKLDCINLSASTRTPFIE